MSSREPQTMSDSNNNHEIPAYRVLQEAVSEAASSARAVRIVGGDSKHFYGREPTGDPLSVSECRGIVNYQPTELVITARAGTPLSELEDSLAQRGQMLGFEPPAFGATATLGGTIACALSGPRRPYLGAARDFVLGVKLLNGKSEILRFGGEVMKNVAGYDLSRLLTGSLGTLGIILEVSLKVLPRPLLERTLCFSLDQAGAIDTVNRWSGRPLPFSASAFDGERLLVRLSGTESGVEAAARELGGEPLESGGVFWSALNEQTLPFFQRPGSLWRLSVPSTAPPLALPGQWFLEWGGAQRWLRSEAPAVAIREAASAVAGHATLFRGGDRQGDVFQPLPPALLDLHRRLKQGFDPAGIFNPGRLYPEF